MSEEELSSDCFTICRGVPVAEDGKTLLNKSLSPNYATLEKATAALVEIKEKFHDAKIWRHTFFHYGNIEERDAWLRTLA